jgi:CelD/BcsL family acetyltransferase involved in cellulose biosynthesis
MDVSLQHPDELAPEVIAAWRELRTADARYASPFLAPEFALAAGKVRSDARVLVARGEQGMADLILPLQLAGGMARPLGAPLCEINGPILSEWGPELDLPDMLAAAGIPTFSFSGWPGTRAVRGLKLRRREGQAIADLSAGFDVWLDGRRALHPGHFAKTRRLARLAENEFGWMSVDFATVRAKELETLVEWKREQCERTGRHDVLAQEQARALLDACAAEVSEAFSGVLAKMKLGGRMAAAAFCLRSGKALHVWLAGYDPRFGVCSPGLVLTEKLLERAAAAGVTEVALGPGDGVFGRYYGSYQMAASDGSMTASGIAGGARAMMANLLGAFGASRETPVREARPARTKARARG